MLRLCLVFLLGGGCTALGLAQAPSRGGHPIGAEVGAGFVVVGPNEFGALAGFEETAFIPTREGEVALLRYFNASSFCLIDDTGCVFPDREAELAAMYGWESDSRWAGAMVATGLSATTTLWHPQRDFGADRTRVQSVGIPLELRLSLFPCPWLGVSATGMGGINRGHNFVGAFVAVQIGYSSRTAPATHCS